MLKLYIGYWHINSTSVTSTSGRITIFYNITKLAYSHSFTALLANVFPLLHIFSIFKSRGKFMHFHMVQYIKYAGFSSTELHKSSNIILVNENANFRRSQLISRQFKVSEWKLSLKKPEGICNYRLSWKKVLSKYERYSIHLNLLWLDVIKQVFDRLNLKVPMKPNANTFIFKVYLYKGWLTYGSTQNGWKLYICRCWL